jgi:hypothetical protein
MQGTPACTVPGRRSGPLIAWAWCQNRRAAAAGGAAHHRQHGVPSRQRPAEPARHRARLPQPPGRAAPRHWPHPGDWRAQRQRHAACSARAPAAPGACRGSSDGPASVRAGPCNRAGAAPAQQRLAGAAPAVAAGRGRRGGRCRGRGRGAAAAAAGKAGAPLASA